MIQERPQDELPVYPKESPPTQTAETVAEGGALPTRFSLTRVLGRGSCGTVHEGLLMLPDGQRKPVALRVCEDSDPAEGGALRQWVESVATQNWAHVALPREFVAGSAGRILVYELLQGASLAELLRRARRIGKPLTTGLVAEVLSQALDGLRVLHEQAPALIHRSIKPSNLHIGRNGEVHLLDLGVTNASLLPGNRSRGLAVTSTLPYLSPEQLSEPVKLTPAADLYALGTVAYEMLAGRPLFDGSTARREFEIRAGFGVHEKLAGLEQAWPGVSQWLAPALAAAPKDRYLSADAWLERLAPLRSAQSRSELAAWTDALLALPEVSMPSRAGVSPTQAATGAGAPALGQGLSAGIPIPGTSSTAALPPPRPAEQKTGVVPPVRASGAETSKASTGTAAGVARRTEAHTSTKTASRTSGVRQPAISSAYGTPSPSTSSSVAQPKPPARPAQTKVSQAKGAPAKTTPAQAQTQPPQPPASPVKLGVVVASLLMALAALWYADQGGPMARGSSNQSVDHALNPAEGPQRE